MKCDKCGKEAEGDCWNCIDDEVVCFECQELGE